MLNQLTPVVEREQLPLAQALGATLATDVQAQLSLPACDNAAMDGVALRFQDLQASAGNLPLRGRAAAGDARQSLATGTAMPIYTGASLPLGADTVVPQEAYDLLDNDRLQVRAVAAVRCADHVRRRGEDYASGDVVLPRGLRLRAQDLGVAASTGFADLTVTRPARVALVMTGNELREPGSVVPLSDGALFDSNTPMLAALVTALGARVVSHARVGDERDATEQALVAAAAGADLLISSGGVSVGAADWVRASVERLGVVHLWRVGVKPGKPVAFGRIGGAHWLGLPGNPVSALVTFLLFAAPILRKLQGRAHPFPEPLRVPVAFARDGSQAREEYLRVAFRAGVAVAHAQQSSGVLRAASWGDGLVRLPAQQTLAPGELVDAWTFTELGW